MKHFPVELCSEKRLGLQEENNLLIFFVTPILLEKIRGTLMLVVESSKHLMFPLLLPRTISQTLKDGNDGFSFTLEDAKSDFHGSQLKASSSQSFCNSTNIGSKDQDRSLSLYDQLSSILSPRVIECASEAYIKQIELLQQTNARLERTIRLLAKRNQSLQKKLSIETHGEHTPEEFFCFWKFCSLSFKSKLLLFNHVSSSHVRNQQKT